MLVVLVTLELKPPLLHLHHKSRWISASSSMFVAKYVHICIKCEIIDPMYN